MSIDQRPPATAMFRPLAAASCSNMAPQRSSPLLPSAAPTKDGARPRA